MIEVVEPGDGRANDPTAYFPEGDDPVVGSAAEQLQKMMEDGARLFQQGRYEEAGRRFNNVEYSII